jgi:hypothetical protein
MKKVNKAIAARIEELNTLIEAKKYEYVSTYDGGTWPYVVNVAPLEISKNGQFVKVSPASLVKDKLVKEKKGGPYAYQSEAERFNMNDPERAADFRHVLNVLLRAYRAA